MALNFSTPTPDFVQRTAESRRITRTLVGDFTFDRFSSQHRNKVFLPRNMTKVLAFHQRNRLRDVETGTIRLSSSRSRGPVLGNGATVLHKVPGGENLVNGMAPKSDLPSDAGDVSTSHEVTNGRPDVESMSPNCLKVKAQNGSIAEQAHEKRRSVRHQLSRQHEDQNAQLFFDLVSIRKKLNFKEQSTRADSRPRKRVKRETVTCHCHLTVWDNRLGLDQKEPIVRKSELCEISTSDFGTAGYVAEIKLQRPFVFKSSELKVSLPTPNGRVLGIGDKYFLEIKIIPTKHDVEWPPVPVLGRSEGDQTSGLGQMAAEKLQNTLCARYMHLPQAPASDVPLSVFFLHEGSTYRSKYGLEVNADWTKGPIPDAMMKQEDQQAPAGWTLDQEGRPFGRRESLGAKEGPKEPGLEPRENRPKPSSTPLKVVYNIDAASAKGVKDFRRARLRGLQCPTCPKQKFPVLEELQFHLSTCHPKYKFAIEKQEHDPSTEDLTLVVFKISAIGTVRPRNHDRDREPRKSEKNLNWQAPTEPLDVHAYVNGDQNWVERNWAEESSKKPESSTAAAAAAAAVTLAADPVSAIRNLQFGEFEPAQKGGFLPAEHVLPFREASKRKYPVVRLKTMTADKETMYTSVSHRQIRVGENARSESDDEMDDGWFVKKSLEALDVAAEKQDWTEEQRLLRRKWNQARLREKVSHPRYLSDCLVRFVKFERAWLREGGVERKTAYADFIDELLQRRVINQEIIRDLWIILHDGESTDSNSVTPVETESPTKLSNVRKESKLVSRTERAESMLRLPPYTCAICREAIEELRRHGVRCSDHDCEAPGVWYHTKCVRCKRKDRFGWKCALCVERCTGTKKAKGKEIAVD